MKYSVIFPSYNVGPYIKQAISCIKAQTCEDWELIIVDDRSTDDTASVAEKAAAEDTRISLVRLPENKGVSNARNTGMSRASGEYILFLDPDDYYEKDLLKTVDSIIEEGAEKPDIVVYSLMEEYYRNKTDSEPYYTKIHSMPDGRYTEPKDIHRAVRNMEMETMLGYPWNKAYRLSYLREHDAKYPVITHVEDILFNVAAFQQCKILTVTDKPLYHYRNSGQTRLTGKYLPEYFALQKRRISAVLKQQEIWGEKDEKDYPEFESYMAGFYFRAFLSMMERDIAAGIPKIKTLKTASEEAETELYRRFKDKPLGSGKAARILYAPLAAGRFRAAYSRAKAINLVKSVAPGLYSKLKQNR